MPVHDPEGSGQVLHSHGEPVATVVWAHDFAERAHTGWFLVPLGDDGEPDHAWSRRLAVSEDVDHLAADTDLSRAAWIARAETVELVTAAAAVAAAERMLAGDPS
jgi:hypothetical protein